MTSYKFPTLLATSGTNENGTVEIDVVSFRRFGKGPILREILIRQAHKEDERMGPVKVWKADAVARHGAIHVSFPHPSRSIWTDRYTDSQLGPSPTVQAPW